MAIRRSKDQLIADLEAKLKRLKDQLSAGKEVVLTKDSPGLAEVIATIENAVVQNNTSVAEIIKAISRIKRTGLKFENGTPKA